MYLEAGDLAEDAVEEGALTVMLRLRQHPMPLQRSNSSHNPSTKLRINEAGPDVEEVDVPEELSIASHTAWQLEAASLEGN